jgi:hypothetical protein
MTPAKPAVPAPAAPATQCITHDERVKLAGLIKADQVVMNKQSRLAIERAKTQQDIAEFHQELSRRYDLDDGDKINNITGKITKKTG